MLNRDAQDRLDLELDRRARRLAAHWNFRPDGRADLALREVIKRQLSEYAERVLKAHLGPPSTGEG